MRLVLLAALLSATPALAQDFKVTVLSATVKDQTIPDAEVILQRNGENSITGKTDAGGVAKLGKPKADDPTTILIVKKAGYSPLVAKCPCEGLTYALSPNMQTLDGLRIVLNWDKAPADLDSHLVYPGNHVYFESKKGSKANLDVDDVNGFGPETITIEEKKPGEKYVYAVHNYSQKDQVQSTGLSSDSRAKVFVYIGESLVRTYYVPQGKPGTMWVLFGIGAGGEFNDINALTSTSVNSRGEVRKILEDVMNSPAFSAPPPVQADAQTLAKDLNKRGETAYHAKKMQEAIDLYQQAINQDPEFAQAYSNIGLAYQKAGRTAEAIWANRKAIALAAGSTANTVKASSYFNIARIYEDQQKWQEAKSNFEKALENKTHDSYKKGIARMNEKLK